MSGLDEGCAKCGAPWEIAYTYITSMLGVPGTSNRYLYCWEHGRPMSKEDETHRCHWAAKFDRSQELLDSARLVAEARRRRIDELLRILGDIREKAAGCTDWPKED